MTITAYATDGYSVNVGAYVAPELKRDLKDIAHANRTSVSEEIRVALERHVTSALTRG